MGKQWKQWQTLFSWAPKITADGDDSHEIKKTLTPWKESYDQPRQHIKKQRLYFVNTVYIVKSIGFPVVMYGCESWTINKAEHWRRCLWTMMLEKTLQSPLDCKEIQPVNPEGNQFWLFIGRTDAEAPTLWLPDAKNWLIRKVPDAGKDWWQEEKGTAEDKRVGWHRQLSGHESEQALEDGEVQGRLACCSPSGHKELDMPEWLSNNNNKFMSLVIFILQESSFAKW